MSRRRAGLLVAWALVACTPAVAPIPSSDTDAALPIVHAAPEPDAATVGVEETDASVDAAPASTVPPLRVYVDAGPGRPRDEFEEMKKIDDAIITLDAPMRACIAAAKIDGAGGVMLILHVNRDGVVVSAKTGGRAHLWNDATISAATASCLVEAAKRTKFGLLSEDHPEVYVGVP